MSGCLLAPDVANSSLARQKYYAQHRGNIKQLNLKQPNYLTRLWPELRWVLGSPVEAERRWTQYRCLNSRSRNVFLHGTECGFYLTLAFIHHVDWMRRLMRRTVWIIALQAVVTFYQHLFSFSPLPFFSCLKEYYSKEPAAIHHSASSFVQVIGISLSVSYHPASTNKHDKLHPACAL